jgi:hypothetical protein
VSGLHDAITLDRRLGDQCAQPPAIRAFLDSRVYLRSAIGAIRLAESGSAGRNIGTGGILAGPEGQVLFAAMRANAGIRGLDDKVAIGAKAGATSLANGCIGLINLAALLTDYTRH